MLKRLGIWLLMLMVAIGSFGTGFAERRTAATNGFSDVQEQYWASDAIKGLVREGIMSGYPDGTFGPDKTITREQFAVILVNAFGLKTTSSNTPIFKDVPTSRWSYGYIDGAKDYLTGYFYKNGSQPTFDPEGPATREDVAVALVKAMGLENEKIDGNAYLNNQFDDVNSISPKLRDQVAIAVKFSLMSGFPNDTFKGNATINRASTAALFYKAMKSPYFKDAGELQLNVSMADRTNTTEVKFSGTATSGAALTINGATYATSNGRFNGSVYLDKGVGTYTYVFKITTADGQSKSVTKTVIYQTKAPEIKLGSIPATTATQYLNVTGKVNKPDNSYPRVYVNEIETRVYSDGTFFTSIKLSEGVNTITVRATSLSGISSTVTKKVSYNVTGPTVTFYSAPVTSVNNSVVFSGKVRALDNATLKFTMNDAPVSLTYSGEFSLKGVLKEGENLFVFKATDATGKVTIITKKVVCTMKAPTITFYSAPETSSNNTVVFSGKVKSLDNATLTLTMNDAPVMLNYGGEFSHKGVLKEGENFFVFKATDTTGKVTIITKKVVCSMTAPTITFYSAPETSAINTVTFSGKVKALDIRTLKLTMNDAPVSLNYGGEFSHKADLKEGENFFVFKATDSTGKVTSLTKKVVFNASVPVINLSAVPENTSALQLVIKGAVTDSSDRAPKLWINDSGIALDSKGEFTYSATLRDGENTFVFKAQNSSGKTVTLTKTVKMAVGSPAIKVTSDLGSNKPTYQLKGILTDPSYPVEKAKFTVNGKSVVVPSNGEWHFDVVLNEGKNTLTLEVVSAGGKTATLAVQVNFAAPAPTLNVSAPETSDTEMVQISGNVYDINDDKTVVTVNGVKVDVNGSGNWNYAVKLAPGDNKITVVAHNVYGKSVKVEKVINYTKPAAVVPAA